MIARNYVMFRRFLINVSWFVGFAIFLTSAPVEKHLFLSKLKLSVNASSNERSCETESGKLAYEGNFEKRQGTKLEENDIYFSCKQLFARPRTNFQDFAKFRLHVTFACQ